MNEIVKYQENPLEIAKMYAKSDLVPTHFRKTENAFIALQMAARMDIDPFLLMQNLYVIHGKPGIEAKLVIAMLNASGHGPISYEFSGDGDDYGCVCKTAKGIEGPRVTIGMAKAEGWVSKQGSKWKTMPDLMLRYRAATFLARTNFPETLMGMHTKDELSDMPVPVTGTDSDIDLADIPEKRKTPAYCGNRECEYCDIFKHEDFGCMDGMTREKKHCAKFVQADARSLLKEVGKDKYLAACDSLGLKPSKNMPEYEMWKVWFRIMGDTELNEIKESANE